MENVEHTVFFFKDFIPHRLAVNPNNHYYNIIN